MSEIKNNPLTARIGALTYRAKALQAVRRYFDQAGFVEVETPVGILAPAAEEYIECPRAGDFFLRSSPELQMKRLLCAGMDRIYQIGPCFRAGENGRLHRSEFSMLEWYMAHCDYMELLKFTQGLVRETAHRLNGSSKIRFRGKQIDLDAPWEIISVRDAFQRYAGRSADEAAEEEGLFELLLTDKVEPALPEDRPCVMIDYPVRFGAFARPKSSDPGLVERWELYIGGVELCNTYGELCDPQIQRERFLEFAETRKRNGLAEYPVPDAFLDAFDEGMPESAGSAMGFDRLVMLLAGMDEIGDVSYPLDS